MPDFENVLLVNGLGATGLTAGPFLGDQLAKLALGEELQLDVDLYPVGKIIEKR